jgi:regulator of protease activity HflC (stomatin/prohibitin superfamily)
MSDEDDLVKKGLGLIGLGFFIIVVLILAFSTFYTIPSGEEGVLFTWDKAEVGAIEPGPHFKIPIAQHVVTFDIKTQKYSATATAASKDLQDVSTDIAVNYHINKGTTPQLFADIGMGYEERVIQPAVQEVVKGVTAKFTAEELITRRSEVSQEIKIKLQEKMLVRNIVVEDISITEFKFGQAFAQAIESKVTAEQRALEQKNLLEKIKYEAEQVRATAEGQKDARIAQAQADAETIRLTKQAEAVGIQLVQEQLKQSPQYIDYIRASKWNGQYPQMYMVGGQSPTLLMQVPEVK